MDDVITLYDEDGETIELEFLDLIDYKEHQYVVLLPIVDSDEPEAIVLEVIEIPGNDDEESYVSVDNLDILECVFTIFQEKHMDEFEFLE